MAQSCLVGGERGPGVTLLKFFGGKCNGRRTLVNVYNKVELVNVAVLLVWSTLQG